MGYFPSVRRELFIFQACCSKTICLFAGGELSNKFIDAAVHDRRQVVIRQADAMIRDAVLWIVVRADFFGAFACSHLRAAVCLNARAALFFFHFVETCAQDAEGPQFILQLRTFILAGNDDACWLMSE